MTATPLRGLAMTATTAAPGGLAMTGPWITNLQQLSRQKPG
jgi:hypothetical protein